MADLVVGQILKDAGGDGATKKLAQRKLNNASVITNHCGLQNHPSRIKKRLSALKLTASLAEIRRAHQGQQGQGQVQGRHCHDGPGADRLVQA